MYKIWYNSRKNKNKKMLKNNNSIGESYQKYHSLSMGIIFSFLLSFNFLITPSTFADNTWQFGSNGASYKGSSGSVSIGKNGFGASGDSWSIGSNGASYSGKNGSISIGTGAGSGKVNINGGGGPIFNGPGLSGGAKIVENGLDGNVSKEPDIKALIVAWTNFLLPIAAVIAVLAIVWAGFLYITSFGDDGRIETAKKIIIWVAVGIVVMAGAYAIVNFFMDAVFK